MNINIWFIKLFNLNNDKMNSEIARLEELKQAEI